MILDGIRQQNRKAKELRARKKKIVRDRRTGLEGKKSDRKQKNANPFNKLVFLFHLNMIS